MTNIVLAKAGSIDLYANKLNDGFLRNALPPDDMEIDWVRAAIAYGSDSTTLVDSCLRSRRRLDIWMRYDHTVPVAPQLLRKLLASTARNIFCTLVPDVLHAKVIWWKNYGAYIGSANLTDRAWNTNIELGIFLSESQMDATGVTEQLEAFFEQLVVCEAAFPLDEDIIKEQEAILALRATKLKELNDLTRKKRKVQPWEGPAFVSQKKAQDRQRENFLREWRDGLSFLRTIAEQAPAHRPAWLNGDVPAAWQADQFLHAYYYNRVKEGNSYPFEEFYTRNKNDPAAAVEAALKWWANLPVPPSDEDNNCHQRAPVIRDLLSKKHLPNLTLQDFQQVCLANHSTVDHVRRMPLEALGLSGAGDTSEKQRVAAFAQQLWATKNRRGESIADVLRYVLDGGPADAMPDRLFDAAKTPDRRIPHLGTNQLAEIAGWARPEICPPRNGRTSKGLKALGFDVSIY